MHVDQLTSRSGLLTILQIVLGVVIFSLSYNLNISTDSGRWLQYTAFLFFANGFLILLSLLLSGSGTEGTFYFKVYHFVALVLFIGIPVWSIINNDTTRGNDKSKYWTCIVLGVVIFSLSYNLNISTDSGRWLQYTAFLFFANGFLILLSLLLSGSGTEGTFYFKVYHFVALVLFIGIPVWSIINNDTTRGNDKSKYWTCIVLGVVIFSLSYNLNISTDSGRWLQYTAFLFFANGFLILLSLLLSGSGTEGTFYFKVYHFVALVLFIGIPVWSIINNDTTRGNDKSKYWTCIGLSFLDAFIHGTHGVFNLRG